jgi:Fur family ferric uptake transcriptional regulator
MSHETAAEQLEGRILARLVDAGFRLTEPRRAIARSVAEQAGQFTAEAVWEQVRPRGVGRATVFRTLDTLAELGVLSRMHVDGCHRYTVCDLAHHHHLVCSACGRVAEVDAHEIEREIRRLAERHGFRLERHQLEFVGRCAPCQASA